MIVLQVILWILFALILLVGLMLCLKITVRLKYGEQKAVILGIGIFRINLTKLRERREKRKKKKPKIQSLAKSLPKEMPVSADEADKKENCGSQSAAVSETTKTSVLKSVGLPTENKADNENAEKMQQAEKKSVVQTAKKTHEQQNSGIEKLLKDFIKGKSIRENMSLLKEILVQTSEKFSKYADIKVKKLKVVVSCPEAAETAVLFGLANGAVCSIIGIIESFSVFSVEKGAVSVYQDYVSGKSSFEVDISFSMRVFRMLLCLTPTLKSVLNNKTKSSSKEKSS